MRPAPTVLSVLDMNPRKLGSMEEYAAGVSGALRERGCRSVMAFTAPVPAHVQSAFAGTETTFETFRRAPRRHFYLDVADLIRRYRPSVAHFHFLEQFSLLPLVPRALGVPLVVFTDHFRQPLPLGWSTRLSLALWNATVPRIAHLRLIAISEHIRRVLIEGYGVPPRRIHLVLNGVNPARFSGANGASQLRSELAIPADARLVMTVAALIPQKGVADLLTAAPQVLQHEPKAFFVIVGDGPLRNVLEHQAEAGGIASRVRFTGLRSDVHRLLALAEAVVVPSVWQEPAGLVVLEAMASGKPVIATRVGGIPEYIEEGVSGVLVEPNRPDRIADALCRLLVFPDQAREMGRAGRKRVLERFSMGRWVEETVRVYEEGLGKTVSKS